jgi:hypothetical protein
MADEWLLLCTAVARMSELHPTYRCRVGLAHRDLENMIRAHRAKLRGCSPDGPHDPPEAISEVSDRHKLDLVHNALYLRRPGPSNGHRLEETYNAGYERAGPLFPWGNKVLFRGLEVEWTGAARYLRTHAVPALESGEPLSKNEGHTAPKRSPRPHGPAPGSVDRYGKADRALYPKIERIISKEHKSVHAACQSLASKIKGTGTPESKAQRVAKRFRKEHPPSR